LNVHLTELKLPISGRIENTENKIQTKNLLN